MVHDSYLFSLEKSEMTKHFGKMVEKGMTNRKKLMLQALLNRVLFKMTTLFAKRPGKINPGLL